jgi:hypothetical protein
MPSFLSTCAGLCLTLSLANTTYAAEPPVAAAAGHTHWREVPTYSKVGHVSRAVACTEAHPAPPVGAEHSHRWFKSGDKRPGQWITEACTQIHPEPKVCSQPAPKGGCAHKPRC